jgi:hypothetical protein
MNKSIPNHKRAQIGMIAFLALTLCSLAVISSIPTALATEVQFKKSHLPLATKFHAGDTINFILGLRVLDVVGAPLSIKNLNITDDLPTGLTYVVGTETSTPLASFTQTGQKLFWDFGSGPFATDPQATVSFNVTVDAGAAGFLVDNALAKYHETLTGTPSTPGTSDTIFVAKPSITLTKTPSTTKIESGGSVTYTYVVTNTGNVALTVGIVDDHFGTIASGESLAIGESKTFTKTTTLTTDTTNTVTATGVDQSGASVTATASATVKVLHPAIALTKTPSATKVESGASVTYTYVVTNTGDTGLTVGITDDTFGTIATGESLAAGASKTFTKTTTLTADTTNIAIATGIDQTGASVTARATATVKVIHPSITLTKTPSSPKVESGASITYTYVVTNTGDTTLTVGIVDDHFGTIASGESLSAGASKTFTKTTTLTTTTTNIATATGVDQLLKSVTATATATVTVIHPGISLTKTPSTTKIESGGSVTYTYVVSNTGDTGLTVGIVDDKLGTIASGESLGVGASKTFTKTTTLTADTTNTATATGVDQTGASVTATASATVKVIHPDISLTKTPSSPKIESGTDVTYTYVVTNTGNTALTVGIVDDHFGTIASGESLTAGASKTFTKTTTLTTDTTNIAIATGVDQTGASVTARATATVKVIHPAIALTKTPSAPKIETGTSVTYTYVVTNTGDTGLTVDITDDHFGTIASGVSLGVGASQTFTHTATLTADTTNTATATGTDQTGAKATAVASATVKVIHPSISFTKSPSATKVETGTDVTYTYVVSNTGDTGLTVDITDDHFGTIASGVPFAAGESHTYTHTATLTADITNVATATGVDQTGASVSARATATVKVIHPGIALTKTPSSPKIESGTDVTYTYVVTNTGDTPLTVDITDDKLGSIATGVSLPPGASQTFTKTTTLTADTTNTATAVGTDQTGAKVRATASATVKVIHPAISLTKTPSPNTPQQAPATFTYTYTVTNTGDVTLTGVTVYDDTFSVQITLGTTTLNPGQSTSGTYSQTYTAAGTYTDTATATGTDQLGVKVIAHAEATVVVTPPPALATRTQGFWATHTTFTEWVFDNKLGSDIKIDSNTPHAKDINTYGKLFGGFWCGISKMSDGTGRSGVDQNRTILLQQLLAAILNHAASGVTVPIDPVTGYDLITAANMAYSGTDGKEMMRIKDLLDTFNGSGENISFPPGLPDQGKATPKVSQAIAYIKFWDIL